MLERAFLLVSAIVWLGYGLYCFVQPGALDAAAGVRAHTPTGTTELRAMYGGAQAGIGLLCALSLARPALRAAALWMLACVAGGLGVARLAGALLDGSFSAYTWGGLGLEWASLAIAAWLLRGAAPPATPAPVRP